MKAHDTIANDRDEEVDGWTQSNDGAVTQKLLNFGDFIWQFQNNQQTNPLKSPFTYLQIKTLLLSQQLLFKLLLFCFRRDRTNTYEYKPAKQLHITIVTTVAVVATAINEMTGGMVEKSRKYKSLWQDGFNVFFFPFLRRQVLQKSDYFLKSHRHETITIFLQKDQANIDMKIFEARTFFRKIRVPYSENALQRELS